MRSLGTLCMEWVKMAHPQEKMAAARGRAAVIARHLSGTGPAPVPVTPVAVGEKYSEKHRVYASASGKLVSWFHDVPVALDTANCTATMVVEVPRWSNAKFEISTSLAGNPIVQDTKNGQPRFVRNLFPYHGYIHNYGALPQTWEDLAVRHKVGHHDLLGDGDPVDVCEIGQAVWPTGLVRTVKILGLLALVDDGELDWKVIVVDTADPLAEQLQDIGDVNKACPGLLAATRQWFRDYKLPDGKPCNEFALDGEYRNQQETMAVLVECHDAWKKLVQGESLAKGFALENVLVGPHKVDQLSCADDVKAGGSFVDAVLPPEINKSYYY